MVPMLSYIGRFIIRFSLLFFGSVMRNRVLDFL